MIVRLKVILEQDEYSALLESALADLRDPSTEARYILRQGLERLGLLSPQKSPSPASQRAVSGARVPYLIRRVDEHE